MFVYIGTSFKLLRIKMCFLCGVNFTFAATCFFEVTIKTTQFRIDLKCLCICPTIEFTWWSNILIFILICFCLHSFLYLPLWLSSPPPYNSLSFFCEIVQMAYSTEPSKETSNKQKMLLIWTVGRFRLQPSKQKKNTA